jgi:biotin-(acetyl-CoA carboxylase) ligase
LGKQVTVQELTASGGPGNSYGGIAEDVDAAGNLILRLSTGGQVTLAGGEVTMQQNPTIVSTQPI